jgi:hypothetical protein
MEGSMMHAKISTACRSLSAFSSGVPLRLRRGSLTIGLIAALSILASTVQAQTPSPLTIQPSTGRVGIGTTTPTSPLTVSGTIESTTGGIKYPDGSVQSTAATFPSGAILFFASATCPGGWSEYTAARGRYIVGLNPGGTLGGTSGTALSDLENRPAGQHTHNYSVKWVYGGSEIASGGYARFQDETRTTDSGNGLVAGTNAPYIQLLVCKKD